MKFVKLEKMYISHLKSLFVDNITIAIKWSYIDRSCSKDNFSKKSQNCWKNNYNKSYSIFSSVLVL